MLCVGQQLAYCVYRVVALFHRLVFCRQCVCVLWTKNDDSHTRLLKYNSQRLDRRIHKIHKYTIQCVCVLWTKNDDDDDDDARPRPRPIPLLPLIPTLLFDTVFSMQVTVLRYWMDAQQYGTWTWDRCILKWFTVPFNRMNCRQFAGGFNF